VSDAFSFLDPGPLVDGDLSLVLVKTQPADPVKKHVPQYQFEMRRTGSDAAVGRISLRVAEAHQLCCPGHIGYGVDEPHRGHRYAARACRLLYPLALAHGLRAVWITCDPPNKASARTIELAGGKYVETLCVPPTHEMHRPGGRRLRRYRIDLGGMPGKQ
jgi:predicted acetyltransferase